MTWFQLIRNDESESRPAVKLVPNSAFFLNPVLAATPFPEPRPEPERTPLRLLRLAQ